ncbi:MAG: hypothetical protein FJ138_06710, partial [Deltaproteobacteria bacterium]|nr:hypothetical protein [Deltaproteobacteria bacterium]
EGVEGVEGIEGGEGGGGRREGDEGGGGGLGGERGGAHLRGDAPEHPQQLLERLRLVPLAGDQHLPLRAEQRESLGDVAEGVAQGAQGGVLLHEGAQRGARLVRGCARLARLKGAREGALAAAVHLRQRLRERAAGHA